VDFKKVGHLAKYYLEAEILGHKKPILAGFKVTYKCNLACRQCPYWRREYPELSFNDAVKVIDQMHEAGAKLLILEGGEPLLWKDGSYTIEDLITKARESFFTVGITTNGTLPIDTEADIVWVSVDGLKETHNQLRNNSFDKIMTNLKESKHPKIFANITINKVNVREIEALIKFLSPIVKGITIQFFYPYEESENLALTKAERVEALDKLIGLKRAGYPLNDSVVALEVLKYNHWRCEPWMLCNGEPDGKINYGCYLKNRITEGQEDPCKLCGFAAHTEISLAYQGNLEAIWAGRKILDIF